MQLGKSIANNIIDEGVEKSVSGIQITHSIGKLDDVYEVVGCS